MKYLTNEEIADVAEMAGYAMQEWALTLDIRRNDKTVTIEEGERTNNGPRVDTEHVLTFASIREAASKVSRGGICNTRITREVNSGDLGNWDTVTADAVLQVALFSKIVYS